MRGQGSKRGGMMKLGLRNGMRDGKEAEEERV